MIRLLRGNVFDMLPTLAPGSVDLCVTSPPYWMLRSYLPKGHPLKPQELGSEPTPAAFVDNLVRVFRLVRDCLAEHGTCWVNIGDSYAGGGRNEGRPAGYESKQDTNTGSMNDLPSYRGIPSGNLCLIPQRLAIALQEPYEHDVCIKAPTDRAWLAALMDGEGCIGIRHVSRKDDRERGWQDNYSPYSCIAMSDLAVIERCVTITGIGKVNLKSRAGDADKRGVTQRRDQHGWRLDGPPAVDVVRAIYPYLIAKKKQACLVYTLDCLNKTRAARNVPVPADVQEKKARLWELIKQCNQRQPVDLPDWVKEPQPRFEPGWLVRSVVVWHKPAPMPASLSGWAWRRCRVKVKAAPPTSGYKVGSEGRGGNHPSVGSFENYIPAQWSDCPGCQKCEKHGGFVLRKGSWRPTSSWEPILMLAKTADYFCDGEGVKQPSAAATVSRYQYPIRGHAPAEAYGLEKLTGNMAEGGDMTPDDPSGANLRDVWTIAAEPLREKHYASFPTALVLNCIRAGTSLKGYCPTCGKPWCRVIESAFRPTQDPANGKAGSKGLDESDGRGEWPRGITDTKTLDWRPSCSCPPAPPRPGLVLDPFAGSGRTLLTARRLGLDAVGVELNESYVQMATRLIEDDSPLFNQVETVSTQPGLTPGTEGPLSEFALRAEAAKS